MERFPSKLRFSFLLLLVSLACGILEPPLSTPESPTQAGEPGDTSEASGDQQPDVELAEPAPADLGEIRGRIIYLPFDPELGAFEPELVILQPPNVELSRISIPGAASLIRQQKRTCGGSRVLLDMPVAGETRVLLVDAFDESALILDLPPGDFILDPARRGFKGSGCVDLLFDNGNIRAYAVDTDQGEIIDLSSILGEFDGGGRHLPFGGTVSTDGKHLVLITSNGSWLVPTGRPSDARPLGEPSSFFGSISGDGEWVVYGQGEQIGGLTEVVVERVGGSGSSTVLVDRRDLYSFFIPNQERLIITR